LFNAPQAVCFAVFKETEVCITESLTMTLVCIPNHEQIEKTAVMKGKDHCAKLNVIDQHVHLKYCSVYRRLTQLVNHCMVCHAEGRCSIPNQTNTQGLSNDNFSFQGEGYTRLALSTADRKMRPNDKAYTKVEGCYKKKTKEDFFLQ
jgi:hypothetical protein